MHMYTYRVQLKGQLKPRPLYQLGQHHQQKLVRVDAMSFQLFLVVQVLCWTVLLAVGHAPEQPPKDRGERQLSPEGGARVGGAGSCPFTSNIVKTHRSKNMKWAQRKLTKLSAENYCYHGGKTIKKNYAAREDAKLYEVSERHNMRKKFTLTT